MYYYLLKLDDMLKYIETHSLTGGEYQKNILECISFVTCIYKAQSHCSELIC